MAEQAIAPIRICLVENHKIVLYGLEKLIESQKPKMEVVGSFASCSEVLPLLNELDPGIILFAVNLNDVSELDVIPKLAAQSKARILIISELQDPSFYDDVILSGARGVISKKEPLENILKAIEKVCEGQLWLDQACINRLISECSHQRTAACDDLVQRKIQSLTPKERKIVASLRSDIGVSGKVLAAMLSISESTLRNHLTSIYEKLGVGNKLELWKFVHTHGVGEEANQYHH
jgi:two-component system, NarL family, nitrate/nitrite response regulator NarL